MAEKPKSKYDRYWLMMARLTPLLMEAYPGGFPPLVQKGGSAKPPRPQAPLKPHWASAREAAFDFLEKNGLPRPDLRDGSQARLEDAIEQALMNAGVKNPHKSQIQKYRKRFVDEFKALKAKAD